MRFIPVALDTPTIFSVCFPFQEIKAFCDPARYFSAKGIYEQEQEFYQCVKVNESLYDLVLLPSVKQEAMSEVRQRIEKTLRKFGVHNREVNRALDLSRAEIYKFLDSFHEVAVPSYRVGKLIRALQKDYENAIREMGKEEYNIFANKRAIPSRNEFKILRELLEYKSKTGERFFWSSDRHFAFPNYKDMLESNYGIIVLNTSLSSSDGSIKKQHRSVQELFAV